MEGPPDWPVGLVLEGRGALGLVKRFGVCVGFDQESLLVHFSSKDKELTRIPRATAAPTTLVPGDLSPATRLLCAAGSPPKGSSWDTAWLRQRVADMCGDVRVVRRLFDEALTLGWQQILEWVPLTASEKAWRTAHHAADAGDLPRLQAALTDLPATGYASRATLLLPHLGAVRANADMWRPTLQGVVAAGAERALDVLVAGLGAPHKAMENAVGFLPDQARATWTTIFNRFETGRQIPAPPAADLRAWMAVSLISSLEQHSLDAHVAHLVDVEKALLDDLVDSGRITAAAPLAGLGEPARRYLLARLDPMALTMGELRSDGHLSECARRSYLARDRASLFGLMTTKRVKHYQALLDVVEGARPDPARLDEETVAKLTLPDKALAQIREGVLDSLPDEVADDPSLWPMFSELAITGKLLPDTNRPANHRLNTWIGLHRLLGLVWEAKFGEAVEHGRALTRHVAEERVEDEVANITAFALDQLGRADESLEALEVALRGAYTENLLVNVSIIASKVRPEVGVRHLARLVDEAPTPELQRAGMSQALAVWKGTDEPFPQVLVPHLQRMLSQPTSLDDYLFLSKVAVSATPGTLSALPNPGGQYDGPCRILKANARLKTDPHFFLGDLAKEFVAVYLKYGRPDWWSDEWKEWLEVIEDSVFVDFGEAFGAAQFIDEVLIAAPELLTQRERFVLAPQAGAHTAAALSRDGHWLNDQAWAKFFFRPIDEFLAVRGQLEPRLAEHLASNFTLCVGSAGLRTYGLNRDDFADEFNAVVDRLRWDYDNRVDLLIRRERILDSIESGPLASLDAIVQRMRRLGSQKREELTRDLAGKVAAWRQEVDGLRLLRS